MYTTAQTHVHRTRTIIQRKGLETSRKTLGARMLEEMVAPVVEEPDFDLARLDDDGGWHMARAPAFRNSVPTTRPEASMRLSVDLTQRAGAYAFRVPMIPGAREPGMLTTFGVHAVVFSGAPIAMDAATTAARQREGGGAQNQRRPARDGSLLKDLWRRLQGSLRATRPS
jgi:hypothetical protein